MTVADLPPVRSLRLDQIQPAPNNPRNIPNRAVEMVATSLREFGWQQPLVVDSAGVLIAGHTRYKAARSLGLDTAPVVVADDLTPEQVRAYRIADNRTGDFTSWDYPALAVELADLAEDFSDVLALADWQGVLNEFNDLIDTPPPGSLGDDPDLNIYVGEKYSVIVVADSEDAIRRVAAACVGMDGVLDVRDRNQR